ncbi:MAG: XTP/dITP diphosphatase [Candidatus Marinimicrobia bacterium]|nr:XTP/dITP diphosphatase [Candidatus Neomarinimicrobiota bacterium]
MKIVIASGNKDKIAEIKSIFKESDFTFLTLDDFSDCPEVIEDGNNLFENALKKAKEISEFTGLPAISDDTGLEVDALDGRPGVYSARYAGENATYSDNVDKLLSEMNGIPAQQRTARFRTVCVFFNGENIVHAEGKVEGQIITERRGDKGFGYDPVFYIEEQDKTFAELDKDEKNEISHRGKALKNLHELLKNKYLKNIEDNLT